MAMSYLNSVSLIAFVGTDPEQRQGRSNEWGWKVEWHKVCVMWNRASSQCRGRQAALTGHLGLRVAKALVALFSS